MRAAERLRSARAIRPLRTADFRLLAEGQLASNVGDALYAVALPWYVLSSHGGAILLATVLAAYGIPRTLLLAVGGHASDRFRPWTVMMLSDASRALGVAALAAVVFAGPASAALLIPIAALLGAGEGMFLPASSAIVPGLLDESQLEAGNALIMGSTQLAVLLGPLVGGLVVATAGPGWAFAADAATFVVSAATLSRIRVARRPRAATPATVSEARGGVLAVLRSERVLQLILVINVAANLGSGATGEVALPVYARSDLMSGAAGYGILLAALGAGALAGTLVAAQIERPRRPAVIASGAFLLMGALFGVLALLHSIVAFGVVLAAAGVVNGFGNILTITAFQRWAPPALLGRVTGLLMLTSFGAFPLSVFLGGLIVRGFGAAIVFPLAGAAVVIAVLAALTQPSWRAFGTAGSRAGGAVADDPADALRAHGGRVADETPAGLGPDGLLPARTDADERDRNPDEVGDELEVVPRGLGKL